MEANLITVPGNGRGRPAQLEGFVSSHWLAGSIGFWIIISSQLQLWDGLITQIMVNNNLATEGNLLVTQMVSQGTFFSWKLLTVAIAASALWIIGKRFPIITKSTCLATSILYSAILASNFAVFFGGMA